VDLPHAPLDRRVPDLARDPQLVAAGEEHAAGAVAQNPRIVGLGIDENTAVIATRQRQLQVLGEGAVYVVDGRAVELQSRAPLARLQARQDVQNVLLWLDTITRLGPEASGVLNLGEAARWLATMLGVPDELVADNSPLASLAAALSARGTARVGS